MSLFGGGSKATPQFTGLATQTSSSAVPITISWGQNRVSPNIIWQGDFQSHKQKQGKGGGKGGTTYTYSASFVLGLCYGESHGVLAVWKDQSKIDAVGTPNVFGFIKGGSGFSFILGTTPQDPWGYLTSKHPDQALGYPGITLACASNYDLGQSNTLGQHSFEIQSLRWDTAKGGSADALDADPALIVEDFLSEPKFGVGFDMDVILNLYSGPDAETTGDNAFQTYCRAMGFGMSPVLNSQNRAGDILERWAKLCNTAIVSSGYALQFKPYGPDEVTGNGVTYIPDFEVRYTIGYNDVLGGKTENPFQMSRKDPNDAFNSLSMIIANRANEYNELPVPWRDQGLVDEYGLRKADNLEAKEITELAMAQVVVALVGQRGAYVRNVFNFTLPMKYTRIEAMDILILQDPALGDLPVLVTSSEENDNGDFEIEAEEYYSSISQPTANTAGGVTNTPKNTAVEPGPSNDPIVMEPPSALLTARSGSSDPQIWIALSGGDGTTHSPNWGGAKVHLSTDDIQYVEVGDITSVARMGKTTATLATDAGPNPDLTHTLKVNVGMSGGEFTLEATPFDAESGSNLVYVDGAAKEFLSFEVPTLTGAYAYDLDNLWRGQYGSPVGAHASGSNFTFIDDAIFKYTLPPEYIGKTLYLKFQSMNIFESSLEDLSTLDPYVYTPGGGGFGTGVGGTPQTPTSGATSGNGFNRVTWTANTGNDNVVGYDIYRATGASQVFGSATKIDSAPPNATSYVDPTAVPDQAYTYFVVARNAVGDNVTTPTGHNATATGASGVIWSVTATGTGASQGITIPYPVANGNRAGIFVFVNGIRYETTEYSIAGTTLTITSNAAGDLIQMVGTVTS